MSPETRLRRIITNTERLLPGRPRPDDERDPRWQAIIRIGAHIPEQPEPIWAFTVKWGRHRQEDVRTAVAVVLLEHLLEHHFQLIFPRLRPELERSKRFADTLRRCWLVEAAWPPNARKLDRLAGKRRQRRRAREPASRPK
jgi:hypothetical protein